MKILLLNFLSLFIFALIYGQESQIFSDMALLDRIGLYETNGYIYARDQEDIDSSRSPDEGLKKAIENVKKKILQYKGEKVTSNLYSQKLYDNLKEKEIFQSTVSSRSEGYITSFTIITNSRKLVMNDEFTRICVYAKARYEKSKGSGDPAFGLTVKVNKRIFLDGDELTIQARSALKGYLSVFCVDENGSVSLLFPNSINTNNIIPAAIDYRLPTHTETEATASYRMYLPEGKKETLEFLRIIITSDPFSTADINNIDDFPGRFVKIDRERMDYIDIGYKIISR